MINYTIYEGQTGEVITTGIAQKESDVVNLLSDTQQYLLEKSYFNQYIENGIIVNMPLRPEGEYIFDYSKKEWVFDVETAIKKALYKRDQLLLDGPDRISPMWWSSMTPEEQQAWIDYRQALLDITEQPNYPQEIVWPTKP
jgi:Phage tail assembly chaperone protein